MYHVFNVFFSKLVKFALGKQKVSKSFPILFLKKSQKIVEKL